MLLDVLWWGALILLAVRGGPLVLRLAADLLDAHITTQRDIERNSEKDKIAAALAEGREAALNEISEVAENRGVSYREAASIIQKKCSACNRSCIHCARAESSSQVRVEINDFDKIVGWAGPGDEVVIRNNGAIVKKRAEP